MLMWVLTFVFIWNKKESLTQSWFHNISKTLKSCYKKRKLCECYDCFRMRWQAEPSVVLQLILISWSPQVNSFLSKFMNKEGAGGGEEKAVSQPTIPFCVCLSQAAEAPSAELWGDYCHKGHSGILLRPVLFLLWELENWKYRNMGFHQVLNIVLSSQGIGRVFWFLFFSFKQA